MSLPHPDVQADLGEEGFGALDECEALAVTLLLLVNNGQLNQSNGNFREIAKLLKQCAASLVVVSRGGVRLSTTVMNGTRC